MDNKIIQQNRATRKKLRKQVKSQAARREKLSETNYKLLRMLHDANSRTADFSALLKFAVDEILSVVNSGKFPPSGCTFFDVGFLKMYHANGLFYMGGDTKLTLAVQDLYDWVVENKKGA